uniref:Uncharacterized protein n=1 Tax=Fagus sylvatica TaxID=28930 RepID=A0A2N9HJ57_FAGSY
MPKGNFPIEIPVKLGKILAIRELHVMSERVLFLKVLNLQIKSQQVGKNLCVKATSPGENCEIFTIVSFLPSIFPCAVDVAPDASLGSRDTVPRTEATGVFFHAEGELGWEVRLFQLGTGTGMGSTSSQGSVGSGLAGENLSQHQARLRAAAAAASIYEKSHVYPSANTLVWSPGYAVIPQAPGANVNNGDRFGSNLNISDSQLEAQTKFFRHQIEAIYEEGSDEHLMLAGAAAADRFVTEFGVDRWVIHRGPLGNLPWTTGQRGGPASFLLSCS